MICKMCLAEKALINSHIIPRSFFEFIKIDEKSPRIISNKKGEFTKRSPIGIYDQIVCLDCERLFQKYDDYAKDFLLNSKVDKQILNVENENLGYIIQNYDYHNLKLFFLSVLWRASISSQLFFEKVNLGPYADILKRMIIENNSGKENDFPIVLTRFEETSIGSKSFLNPHLTREIDGVNMYIFYFVGGYKCYIKVDKRPMPESINTVILKPGKPLCVIAREFDNSNEFKLMKKLVMKDARK